MQSITDLYAELSPLIQSQIDAATSRITTQRVTSSSSSTVAATKAFAYSGLGLGNTDDGTTYTLTLTSSSNPGAAAAILATDASGRLAGLQTLSIANGAQSTYSLYNASALASYFAGPLGVGAVATSATPLFVSASTSDAFTKAGRFRATRTSTTNQTQYTQGLHLEIIPQVNSGVTDNGYHSGFYSEILRLNGSDTGTLGGLYGGFFSVGHYGATARTTTFVSGFQLALYAQGGTINDSRLLWLTQVGAVNPTGTNYGLYADAAAMSHYLAGDVRIGTTTAGGKLTSISTTEQLRIGYSNSVYATHTISSAGNYTIGTTGGNLYTTSHVAHPSYVSQLTNWRISAAGEADFRYIYTDELHAKAFIADLEQALAGGQIISKSVAKIYANFAAPTAGNTANLDVEEFAGFAGFRVFADGDLVRIRQFDRSGGGLKISDLWGTVVYSAQVAGSNPPAQRYVFTRHATYPGTGSGTIGAGTLALDYGTTGNGYMEQNAIDGLNGANSPYYQIVTWDTHPKSTTAGQGLKLRVRLGQLRGLTGSNQWGLYAGTGWTANPNEGNVAQYTATTPTVDDAHRYILAGDNGVSIYNADFIVYSSTTPVFYINRVSPSMALGVAADAMTYLGGNAGMWAGNDSGTYKFRLGSVSGGALASGLSWDGSILRIMGSAYIGNGVGFSVSPLLYCAFDTPQGSTVPNLNGHLGQVPTYSGPITGTSGGKYHGALYLEEGTTNLLTNNSFETNLTGVTANGGTITQSSAQALLGTYSMRCTSSTTGHGWYYDVASVTSISTQYTFSVYMRGSGNVQLFTFPNVGTSNVTLTSTWTRYTLTFTFGTGATRLVGVQQNGAGSCDWYTDATQLEQKGYATSYAATSRTVSQLYYPAANNFNATDCTLSGWFFLPTLTNRTVTCFGGDNAGSLTVYANSSNLVVARKDVAVVASGVSPTALTWVHVAVTVSGGTVTKLYLNGALVGSGTAASAYATPTWLIVGGYNTSGGLSVSGYVDDFASIGRVLSADEIASIYSSNAPLNVTRSNYELMLANTSTSGYMVGNASGLYGYSDTSRAAGTGAFALVTTNSTALGTEFGSVTLNAGDMMLGSAASGKSNLYYDRANGKIKIRVGTIDKIVANDTGALGIKDDSGNNVLLFSGTVNQILRRVDLATGGSITAGASFDDVIFDSTGIRLKSPTAYTDINALRWVYSSAVVTSFYSLVDAGATNTTLVVRANRPTGGSGVASYVDVAASPNGTINSVRMFMAGVANSATDGPTLNFEFKNTSGTLIGGEATGAWTAATSGFVKLSSAGAIRYRMHYRIVVRASTGQLATLTGDLGVNASATATINTAPGTPDFRVNVTAAGAASWDRIAGTATYDVTYWCIYI